MELGARVTSGLNFVVKVTYINGKTITLQPWTRPEGSRGLGLPDFKTIDT